jgi:hypothetical protein
MGNEPFVSKYSDEAVAVANLAREEAKGIESIATEFGLW